MLGVRRRPVRGDVEDVSHGKGQGRDVNSSKASGVVGGSYRCGKEHDIRTFLRKGESTFLVGSKAGAVATGTGSGRLPEAFAIVRCLSPSLNSVSNSRHVVRSMRISRTAHSCSLHAKGYATYRAGSAFSGSCFGRFTR